MRHRSDDITAPPGEAGWGWNEIQFLEADELRRMAPSIVGLEIKRLGDVCARTEPGSIFYNTIVTARFELRRFLEILSESDEEKLRDECVRHLESALVCLALCQKDAEADVLGVVEYASDRMKHILERMKLLY